MGLVAELNKFLKDRLKLGGEELVCLIHDYGAAFTQVRNLS